MANPQDDSIARSVAKPTPVVPSQPTAIPLTPDAMAGLDKAMRTSGTSKIVDQTRDASLQFRGCMAQDSCLNIPPAENGLNLTTPLLKGQGKFSPGKVKASIDWRF